VVPTNNGHAKKNGASVPKEDKRGGDVKTLSIYSSSEKRRDGKHFARVKDLKKSVGEKELTKRNKESKGEKERKDSYRKPFRSNRRMTEGEREGNLGTSVKGAWSDLCRNYEEAK